jgi:hypothetical protein
MSNKLTFNHDADDFFEAIGIDERHYEVAHYTTIYYILAPVVTTALLGMNIQSSSKSKILEDALLHVRSNNILAQETALLLCFERTYKKTMERIKLYNDLLKDDANGFTNGNMSFQVDSEGDVLGEAIRSLSKLLDARPIAQMIEVLKETSCSYEKFIAFTVDEIDLRVVTGKMTQEELDREEQEEMNNIDQNIPDRLKEIFGKAREKKKPESDTSKNYDDIDNIIRKAFEKDDNDD